MENKRGGNNKLETNISSALEGSSLRNSKGNILDSRQPIVWMDLEMTGLDVDNEWIIEIATIITDGQLNTIAEGPELVLHQPKTRFAQMDQWNQEHHTKTGLWEKVLVSTVTLAQAEEQTLDFIKKHIDPQTAPLAGNSIWQDRRFLAKQMPLIDQYLHYRVIDVTTLKELAKRWCPHLPEFKKKNVHRAKEDITESINELKHYNNHMIRTQ